MQITVLCIKTPGQAMLLVAYFEYLLHTVFAYCCLSDNNKVMLSFFKSWISTSVKLKLYNTCVLTILLYGSECWTITKVEGHRQIWCLGLVVPTEIVRHNDTILFLMPIAELRWTSGQLLTSTIHARRLTFFFGTLYDWMTLLMLSRSWLHSRQKIGRDCLDFLESRGWRHMDESYNILTEAVIMAQNRPLWMLLAASGVTYS